MDKMMEYKGYHATVDFDAVEEVFIGEVFGINDTLIFHGKSVNELKKMFIQCIDDYLELCKKSGKEPEREFKGSFNVRVSPELHRNLALNAANEKKTLNQYVAESLEFALNNYKIAESREKYL